MAHALENERTLSNVATRSNNSLWDKLINYTEFNRYGVYAVLLLWNMCLGGIAVGVGALTSAFELSLLVISAMTLLTFILAIQPMKYVMGLAITATIIDLVIIAINIF